MLPPGRLNGVPVGGEACPAHTGVCRRTRALCSWWGRSPAWFPSPPALSLCLTESCHVSGGHKHPTDTDSSRRLYPRGNSYIAAAKPILQREKPRPRKSGDRARPLGKEAADRELLLKLRVRTLAPIPLLSGLDMLVWSCRISSPCLASPGNGSVWSQTPENWSELV